MNKHILRAALLLVLSASSAFAQTGTDLVEVDPIKCWWRTSTSAVRTGESFDLRLTCAVVETEAAIGIALLGIVKLQAQGQRAVDRLP